MQKKLNQFSKGDIFGSLTLTGQSRYQQEKDRERLYVEAVCVCGNIKYYALRILVANNTKSCGCKRQENIRKAVITHNLASHPLYPVYQDMMKRCYAKNCASYINYGGRGIKVCQEWIDNIYSFVEWASANGYDKKLQIDRIDNNGNYEPNNCRFVTKDENNKNTRRNIFITAFGETKVATEWSRDERCKVKSRTLLGRFALGTWTNEDAITTPALANHKQTQRQKGSSRQLTAWGETKSIIEWSEDERCKIGYSGLKIRLRKGFSPEEAMALPFRKINRLSCQPDK